MSLNQNYDKSAMWIDEAPISSNEIVKIIRRQGRLPLLVQDWILDNTLAHINIDPETQLNALSDYRENNHLTSDEAYADHLQTRHIDESLLIKILSRPLQVVQYREERWGPFAQSLYLQHKERFDMVTYQRLESSNADVMQEIYFRLKDGEESWDGLARQFPGAPADATAMRGPIPVADVEAPVLEALLKSEPGRVALPVQIGSKVIVVALEQFRPSVFGDEVRTALLRQAFDEWIAQECSRMLNKIKFPE